MAVINSLFFFFFFLLRNIVSSSAEPIVRNGHPPSAHSVHSFLHQYTGSFKKPPLRRPQSVIGGGLGSLMVMPRNGSRLGETQKAICLYIRLSKQLQKTGLMRLNPDTTLKFITFPNTNITKPMFV